LPPFPCRGKHCQQDFHRGLAPAAVGERLVAIDYRLVELIDDPVASICFGADRDFPLVFVAIHPQTTGSQAHVPLVERHDERPTEDPASGASGCCPCCTSPAAIPLCPLESRFCLATAELPQRPARLGIGGRLRCWLCLANPKSQLAGVKMIIAAVDSRGGGAIFEFEVGGVTPHHGSTLVPHARHGPHAPHHPTGNSPHDIELVRPLPPGDSTPQAGIEFFGG